MKNILNVFKKFLVFILVFTLLITPNTAFAANEIRQEISQTIENTRLEKKTLDVKENAVKSKNQNTDESLPEKEEETQAGVVLRAPDTETPIDEQKEELDRKYGSPVVEDGEKTVYRKDATHYITYIASTTKTFVDENGNKKELDLDLKKDPQENSYKPKESKIDVELPEKVTKETPIVIKNKENELKLTPENNEYENAVTDKNAIRYNEVSKDIDAQYKVTENGVKEDIILRSFTGENIFQYSFSKEQWKAELELNKVFVKNRNNETLFVLSAPVMVDNAEETSQDIKISLDEKHDRYIVTLEADKNWLEDPKREYPVKIDPTVVVPTKDLIEVTVCTTHGTYGGLGYGYAGYIPSAMIGVPYAKDLGKTRMYFKVNYDFQSIPKEAKIDKATLNLYQYTDYNEAKNTKFGSYFIKSGWNSKNLNWDKAVLLDDEISGKNAIQNSKYGMHMFDIKKAVNNWVQGIKKNNGLVVKTTNENHKGNAFYTPYSTGTAGQIDYNKDKRPSIVIEWSVPDPVDVNYPLDKTTIDLYPMTITDNHGKLAFQGVIGSGIAKPGSIVNYKLNDEKKNFKGAFPASFSYKYPNTQGFEEHFPKGTTKWREKDGNWQTLVPFTNPDFNVGYRINAQAIKDSKHGKEVGSDKFIIYKVKQFDTLPKIANYYGVKLSTISYDNNIHDMMLLKNNTLFIRNPKKNADKPYNPPKLMDSDKEKIDSLLMGRGLHCEFGFEPINLNTGNFYLNTEDIKIPDFTKDFKIERHYNAKSKLNSVFGVGWDFEYDEQLTKGDDDTYLYKRGDGSIVVFSKEGEKYVSPKGYDLELKIKTVEEKEGNFSSGKKKYPVYSYEVWDKEKTKKTFNHFGMLIGIDDDGNKTKLSYDENYNLEKITSPAGNVYSIKVNDDGKIKEITLPNGVKLKYAYDEDANLISYTDALGHITKYNYDENHRMIS